jgi:hypothetical protein
MIFSRFISLYLEGDSLRNSFTFKEILLLVITPRVIALGAAHELCLGLV